MVHRIRCVLCLTAAVVAVVLAAGCSETGSESQTVEGVSAELSAEAASENAQGGAEAEPAESSVSAEDPSGEGDGGSDESDPDEEASDGSAEDGADEQLWSPLGAFLADLRTEAFPDHDFSDPMAAIEQMKYDCMTEQGFRYAMIDWAAKSAARAAVTPAVDEEDYMSTHGYGYADSIDAPEVFEHGYVDPNDAIRDSMSQSEFEAWESHRRECVHHAQTEISRPGVIYLALEDELAALQERVDADPRIAEATAEWSACMAKRGHSFSDQDEIHAYLGGIANPLLNRLRALGGHEHIDAAFQADLDALQAIEAEIAVADLACEETLQQVRYEVKVEHEQQFLDDNQDRLALLRQEAPTMTMPPGSFIF